VKIGLILLAEKPYCGIVLKGHGFSP
jgi:hypothetical protein